jgi:hypothetical protein
MALLNQDFVKFDYDTFQIRFTITDATTSLASYTAWWGVSSAATGTTIVEKASLGWVTGPPAGNTNQIVMGVSTVTVKLGQADFGVGKLLPNTSYYHELVLSSDGDEDTSVVVASGEFTVNPSLFTSESYRP